MIGSALRAWMSRPTAPRESLLRDLGRLAVLLFGVEVVTGSLLALYYEPVPEAAYRSVGTITGTVTLGWLVRSLHHVTGHALLVVVALFLARAFLLRSFLRPAGRRAWVLAVGLLFLAIAFLMTGSALPWDQEAYWRTVITANLVSGIPLLGGWLADVFRGGPEVSGTTLVRLFALHGLVFPWLAFGGLLLARRFRRQGGMP